MIKLFKRLSSREGIQVFVSLIIFAVQLWLDLKHSKLPHYEKTRTKKPGWVR